jgi:hypothetical protein
VTQSRTHPEWDKGWRAGFDVAMAQTRVGAKTKPVSIVLLERHIADLEIRNQDLLIHNNELLARARKAEAQIPKVGWPHQVNDPFSGLPGD